MSLRALIPSMLGLALLAAVPADVQAATPFDGSWSVVVITQSGHCDRAYRYNVQVENGTLHYRGEADINLSGKVSSRGSVQVKIGRGSQSATGTGTLSGQAGSGTWKGKSSSDQCGGRWEAERRG